MDNACILYRLEEKNRIKNPLCFRFITPTSMFHVCLLSHCWLYVRTYVRIAFFSGRKALTGGRRALHPSCASVLFLWQHYLENVAPLTTVRLVAWKRVTVTKPVPLWKILRCKLEVFGAAMQKKAVHSEKRRNFSLGSHVCTLLIGNNWKKKCYFETNSYWCVSEVGDKHQPQWRSNRLSLIGHI